MKRRSFLGLLGGAVAVPFAKVEAAIAGRPTVHFGLKGKIVRQAVNGNSVLTPEIVAKEALRMFEDGLKFDEWIAKAEANLGPLDTITINRPADFTRPAA